MATITNNHTTKGGSRGGRGWAYANPQLLKIPLYYGKKNFMLLLCYSSAMIMPSILMFQHHER